MSKYTDTERLNWLIKHFFNSGCLELPRDIIDKRMDEENEENYKNSLKSLKNINNKINRDELNSELSEYGRRCEYDKEFYGLNE